MKSSSMRKLFKGRAELIRKRTQHFEELFKKAMKYSAEEVNSSDGSSYHYLDSDEDWHPLGERRIAPYIAMTFSQMLNWLQAVNAEGNKPANNIDETFSGVLFTTTPIQDPQNETQSNEDAEEDNLNEDSITKSPVALLPGKECSRCGIYTSLHPCYSPVKGPSFLCNECIAVGCRHGKEGQICAECEKQIKVQIKIAKKERKSMGHVRQFLSSLRCRRCLKSTKIPEMYLHGDPFLCNTCITWAKKKIACQGCDKCSDLSRVLKQRDLISKAFISGKSVLLVPENRPDWRFIEI